MMRRRNKNNGLKVGDRIEENGQRGTVTSFHTKGTVDVLFDGVEYEVRRQLPNVRKVNPRRSPWHPVQRSNPSKVTDLPLIIACGGSKNSGVLPVNQKYSKGLWKIYRSNSPDIPNEDIDVYVLSAKYGLLPEDAEIGDYNVRLVPDNRRTLKKGERKVSSIVPLLQEQGGHSGGKVLFAGGKDYEDALTQAGFEVITLDRLKEFPDHHKRAGIGRQQGALKWFIGTYLPSKRTITNPDPHRIQYQAQVQGIYETQVKEELGLPYDTPFISVRGKRLDERLSKKARREILSGAFAIATSVGRKHDYLIQSPDYTEPFPIIPSDRGYERIAERLSDPEEFAETIATYEETLRMARK